MAIRDKKKLANAYSNISEVAEHLPAEILGVTFVQHRGVALRGAQVRVQAVEDSVPTLRDVDFRETELWIRLTEKENS